MNRHLLLLVAALIVSNVAKSQFRIQSDGKIAFNTTSTAVSSLSFNYAGNSSYYMAYSGQKNAFKVYTTSGHDQYSWGNTLHIVQAPTSHVSNYYVGINATAQPYDGQPKSYGRGYGVYSSASNFTSGYNYAVFGRLAGTNNGTAIYGTTNTNDFGSNISGRYAGYFKGNVKVDGNVTVTGSMNSPLLTTGYDATNQQQRLSISASDMRTNVSISAKLSALDAVSYYKKEAEIAPAMRGDTLERQMPPTFIEKQVDAKQHYALIVEQLEKAFPDLVYEQEDGTKAVNYIEMIPILVHCINELNAKLESLGGLNSFMATEAIKREREDAKEFSSIR